MSKRLGTFIFLAGLTGCAGILGIPSDVDRDDTTTESAETGVPESAPVVTGDAGSDADAQADAPCDLSKPFGGVVSLGGTINTGSDEGSPHFSEDELTLYLDSQRDDAGPNFEVYFTKRGTIGGGFEPLQSFPSVDNSINVPGIGNVGPTMSTDGKTLVFERQSTVTDSDLWIATRASTGDSFGPAMKITSLDTAGVEAQPFVRGDGSEIWFAHSPEGHPRDLAVARSNGSGYVIDTSGILDAVNDPDYDDGYPVISQDKLTLYFASERPSGNAALGALDIYVATRAKVTDPFGKPSLVGGTINTVDREYPGFISPDGCRLYFSSANRTGGYGGQDIYVTTRPR